MNFSGGERWFEGFEAGLREELRSPGSRRPAWILVVGLMLAVGVASTVLLLNRSKNSADSGSAPIPDPALDHYRRGRELFAQGEYRSAIPEFSQALKGAGAQDPDTWFARGKAFQAVGDLDSALRDYCRVLEMDPSNAMAWLNEGAVYAERGEMDRALQDWEEALRINPDLIDARINRVRVWMSEVDHGRTPAECREELRVIFSLLPAEDPRRTWVEEQLRMYD